MPRQYGRHVFDPVIWQVRTERSQDTEADMEFEFDDLNGVLGELTGLDNGGVSISLSKLEEPPKDRFLIPARLRTWELKIDREFVNQQSPSFDEMNTLPAF